MTSRRISTSSFHKAYAQNVHWPSPAYHVYTLRMNTAGLSRSGLNRAMRSALVLHTVHATTWGGSRSARPPTPHQCFPPGTQLFRMHPCSFSPIHSSVSLLLQLPPTPAPACPYCNLSVSSALPSLVNLSSRRNENTQ